MTKLKKMAKIVDKNEHKDYWIFKKKTQEIGS
jgi:hypothetical protein